MWQEIIVAVSVGLAGVCVARSLVRSWRGKSCCCDVPSCPLSKGPFDAARKAAADEPVVPVESLSRSAEKLRRSGMVPEGTD